jgi:hypothetical protein
MTAPLRMSFDVACSADHAFQDGWESLLPHFISAISKGED